jgi:uncharacterized protein (TIGR02391 family)
MRVLADLVASGQGNEGNYLLAARRQGGAVAHPIAEALGWLWSCGLLARDPDQPHTEGAFFVTRAGHRALERGLAVVRATERLRGGLHPEIENRARRQFLLGESEQAVFVAMKAIEVRVRALGGFSNEVIGTALMNQAFGPNGPLRDGAEIASEQDGIRALFAGAYALLRNPSGHREVDYDDVAEAAEAVGLASLLMRILDRVEQRQALVSASKAPTDLTPGQPGIGSDAPVP